MPKLYRFEIKWERDCVSVIAPDDMPAEAVQRIVEREAEELLEKGEFPWAILHQTEDIDIEDAAEEAGAYVIDDKRTDLTTDPVAWIPDSVERDPA